MIDGFTYPEPEEATLKDSVPPTPTVAVIDASVPLWFGSVMPMETFPKYPEP